jgi:signal transduction histidine kinase
MGRLDLKVRLFIAFVGIVSISLLAVFIVGWVIAPLYFAEHLKSLHVSRPEVQIVEKELQRGFEYAWTVGTMWALALSLPLALGLSLFVARRIVDPLKAIQRGTAEFAMGNFQRRIAPVGVPELDRLVRSFNILADSLQGVEQRRQELVGDLAHELRTPLTVLGVYLEGLADGSVTGDPEVYRRLNRETQRLKKLVRDLQELSRAEAGYLPLEVKSVDLKPLCMEVVEKFNPQIQEDGPTLQLELGQLPPVLADPGRVEQILINLLSNALRHTEQGTIQIGGTQKGNFVELYVKDTGMGMTPENLKHVFERFWRAEPSRSQATGGTGIGLTIVKKLVEIQGGNVWGESTLGQGTTFHFTLPLAYR